MITNALADKQLPVYGDGKNVRDWLFVEDHCRALDLMIRKAPTGRSFNVGGHNTWTNIDIVNLLCDKLQQLYPRSGGHYRNLITFVPDRPGHDRRYAIDAGLIKAELGWSPQHTFEQALELTIRWYLDHRDWIEKVRR